MLPGAAISVGAGVAGVAGSFAVAGSTPGFVAAPIAGMLARNLPSTLITAAIVLLGDFGQKVNVVTAVVLAVLLFGTASAVAMLTERLLGSSDEGERSNPLARIALTGLLVTVSSAALTGTLPASLAAGLGSALVHFSVAVTPVLASRIPVPEAIRTLPGTTPGLAGERREVLAGLATALGVGIVGTLLGRQRGDGHGNPDPLDVDRGERTEIDTRLDVAHERSLDVDGLEPLVSERFYEVDINAVNPDVAIDDWSLSVTGAVEQEVTFTYEDLRGFDPDHRFETLRCVGERLNGQKLDNALWTGVPVMDLVEQAGLELDECCVMLRAADDYFEEFPLAALRDGFVAYGMNGSALPRAHGYPVRALIPGHWGEINVKWLTEIEVLETEKTGYWEKRGWHGTGPVNTVAKLHVVNRLGGTVQVAGHAYAGTRGISAVEVSIDGGTTWEAATLSPTLPGDDVWRQWVHEYDPPGGKHEVVVRAIDGTGTVQPKERASPFPSGPSGWVSTTIRG